MAWTDNLRAASFRGVPFKVESHDAQGGRRTVTHEFPQRDTPYVEDMGRRAKEFSVDAYVIGDDYMQQRDALMRACDEPGSAELVHPYLGTLSVVCTGWALRESKNEGRMARFSLSFVESGEAEFPSDTTDPIAQGWAAADIAEGATLDSFADLFSVDGLPDFAVDDAVEWLTNAANTVNDIARMVNNIPSTAVGFSGVVNRFIGSISSLIRTPRTLASTFAGLMRSFTTIFDSPLTATRGLTRMFNFGYDAKPIPVTTTTRARQEQNRKAIIGLVRQIAVIEAARNAPAATFETEQEATKTRDAIADELDAVMEEPTTSDVVYNALQQVRTVVVQGVQIADLPDLVTIRPPVTMPSVVLAYDLYEDADREQEIVERNQLRYPGFVPGAEPILLVTDDA